MKHEIAIKFPAKRRKKLIRITFKCLNAKCTTDQENGVGEGQQQLVQLENSCPHSSKNTTAACIPETVNDVNRQKHRLIEVWSGLQQTVVDKATGKLKMSLWACIHRKRHQFEDF